MIILLSPAKTLDYTTQPNVRKFSEAVFQNEKNELSEVLAKYSAKELEELMNISPSLAELNHERFQAIKNFPSEVPEKQAIFVFTGEAYRGLNAYDLNEFDLDFAQDHLLILSGFYGLLRPLDYIQPYRLEMGTKLKVGEHKNLYEFWGDKITNQLNKDLVNTDKTIINLASDEYFKSLNLKLLDAKIITPKFLDNKNGKYKMITVYAKNTRGAMARYIIENRIKNSEDIKTAVVNGYVYNNELSDIKNWIFTKD